MIEWLKQYAIWGVIGIALFLSFFLINQEKSEDEWAADEMEAILSSDEMEEENEHAAEQSELVIVDLKGEVHSPGIYEMKAGERIHDVIEQAGGFTNDADQTQVNLAQRLQDEMIIIVPQQGDTSSALTSEDSSINDGMVKINYATQQEIETLNGIGPSKAEAIIQFREENGLFQQPEDLLEISGIGEKTLENLKDQIIVP